MRELNGFFLQFHHAYSRGQETISIKCNSYYDQPSTLGRVNQHPNISALTQKINNLQWLCGQSPYLYSIDNTKPTYINGTEDSTPKFCSKNTCRFACSMKLIKKTPQPQKQQFTEMKVFLMKARNCTDHDVWQIMNYSHLCVHFL